MLRKIVCFVFGNYCKMLNIYGITMASFKDLHMSFVVQLWMFSYNSMTLTVSFDSHMGYSRSIFFPVRETLLKQSYVFLSCQGTDACFLRLFY